MKLILKPIFELLTGDVTVLNNIIYNYIVILVIGEIAYQVARSFVGNLYHMGAIDGKTWGSIIHWSVRLVVYFICAYILRFIIWFVDFVAAIPFWIWLSIGFVSILAIVIVLMIKIRNAGESN